MRTVLLPTRALAEVMRSIAVMEAVSRVESDLERSLRGMAARSGGDAALRRLRLAEDAATGAQNAAKINRRLQRARRRAEQALSRLADIAAPEAQQGRTPVDGISAGKPLAELPAAPQLADIHRRLAELRRAKPIADPRPALMRGRDTQLRVREAYLYRQEAVSKYVEARERTADAIRRAASARDRFAEATARSIRAGVGDAAERNRVGELHQAAAAADGRQAEVTYDWAIA